MILQSVISSCGLGAGRVEEGHGVLDIAGETEWIDDY